jgi:hypothetical protein
MATPTAQAEVAIAVEAMPATTKKGLAEDDDTETRMATLTSETHRHKLAALHLLAKRRPVEVFVLIQDAARS